MSTNLHCNCDITQNCALIKYGDDLYGDSGIGWSRMELDGVGWSLQSIGTDVNLYLPYGTTTLGMTSRHLH